jgi:glucose/arabinose dehydrogenase
MREKHPKVLHYRLLVQTLPVAAIMFLLLSSTLVVILPVRPASALTIIPPKFVHSDLVTGLTAPTAMDFAPDGRLFVTQKGGAVRIINDGILLSSPFVTVSVNSVGERGLLGIAFDPDFELNKYVYLYYTTSTSPIHNRVSRFTASSANPNQAVAGSEFVLLNLETLDANIHNAGAIHFGNDGKLYIATGENGVSSNAQSLATRLGKILRINSNGTIPADNPFFNTEGAKKEIWALGLRNPFTFAFKPGTSTMYINDVGNNGWEEINQGISGANYGWPICEGPCSNPNFVDPLHAYEHPSGVGRAISGGAFYLDNQFPNQYHGSYFFGDYAADFIQNLDSDSGTNVVSDFITGVQSPVDIKIGPDGSLYYLSIFDGKVGKVQYVPGGNNFPFAIANANPTSGLAPLLVNFDGSQSGDPDGDMLTFAWEFGDGSKANTANPSHTYESDGPYTAKLTVTDTEGGQDSATIDISVGTPPIGEIKTPIAGTRYNAGDTISFSGSASDAEDGILPNSAFGWVVLFHHNTHTHPFMEFNGVKTGDFVIPDNEEASADVWYRIYLTVTDSSGLEHLSTRDILPNKVTLKLDSNFPGLRINLDGQPQTLPKSIVGVVGMERTLDAPLIQEFCGLNYEFQSWSDGGAASHVIVTPAIDTTYAATYTVASGEEDPHHRPISDFNGDGYSDLAIGVPNEDIGTTVNAGVVNVIYGSAAGLSATTPRADQIWHQNSANIEGAAESGDNFGYSLAVGNFNGDGYSDLAIGVPNEDIGTKADGGSVNVIYGSSAGLSATTPIADQTWSQNKGNIDDSSEAGDNFGHSNAVGDFNRDGYDDLAIGIPNENIGTIGDAGAVSIIYGSASGLSDNIVLPDQFFTQDSTDVEDVAEVSDQFGWSLSSGNYNGDDYSDLAIGVVGEDGLVGAVNVIHGSASGLSASAALADQFWTQNSARIEGSTEGKDRFGFALASGDFNCEGSDDLAIGALEEGNTPSFSGSVNVIYGSHTSGLSATVTKPDQIWTQDAANIENVAEADDKFGSSLTIGDFNKDGYEDLAVGVPNEDDSSFQNSGGVNVIYGSPSGLSAAATILDQFWTQNSADINDFTENGDLFGSSLSTGDFNGDGYDDLAIGVPGEDLSSKTDTGAVAIIFGSQPGLAASETRSSTSREDQFWHQGSSNIEDSLESGDNFGSTIASG